MGILVGWLVLSLAFVATAWLLPGMSVKGLKGAAVAAAVFGILSWLLGKLLFVVLGIVTLGLGFLLFFVTMWVVNVILLKLTNAITDSVEVKTTGTAMIGALLISLISAVLKAILL